MSLFQCENCGCCENTALSSQGFRPMVEYFDWSKMPERKGMLLCSACGPDTYEDHTSTGRKGWHGKFDRVYLPMGQFRTNDRGNLEHIATGSEDFRKFELESRGEEANEDG